MAQKVERLPVMQETWVQSLGQENPLEKGWLPTSVFLPGESMDREGQVGSVHGISCHLQIMKFYFFIFNLDAFYFFLWTNLLWLGLSILC